MNQRTWTEYVLLEIFNWVHIIRNIALRYYP